MRDEKTGDGDRVELDAAYRATRYVVTGLGGEWVIEIGRELPPELRALCAEAGAATWAFVTAWNPGSIRLDEEDNRRRQGELEEMLATAGWRFVAGEGRGAEGSWPAEASCWVAGIGREEAMAVGREFGQNAVVWGAADGEAELIWLEGGGGRGPMGNQSMTRTHGGVAERLPAKRTWWVPIILGIVVMTGVLAFALWSHTTRIRVLDVTLDSVTVESRQAAMADLAVRAGNDDVARVVGAVQGYIIAEGRMPQSLFDLDEDLDAIERGWVLVSGGANWRLYDDKYRLLARGN